MWLRGGLALRRTIGVGVPDGCKNWRDLGGAGGVAACWCRLWGGWSWTDRPDRPSGDFRASAVRHASMGSYSGFVERLGVARPGAARVSRRS